MGMRVDPEGAKNIMQYLRELEGKLIQCRKDQAARVFPFQVISFIYGFAFGALVMLGVWRIIAR